MCVCCKCNLFFIFLLNHMTFYTNILNRTTHIFIEYEKTFCKCDICLPMSRLNTRFLDWSVALDIEKILKSFISID